MSNQKLLMSEIPSKWQPKYVLKRIGDEDINISLEVRNEILKQLASNGRFVQIGEYTVMLNSIKSIDPKWGAKNTPPRPTPVKSHATLPNGNFLERIDNQDEIDEWVKVFGGK